MKLKGFWYDKLLVILFAVFTVIFIGLTALLETRAAIAELVAAVIIFSIAAYRVVSAKYRYKKFMETTSKTTDIILNI